MSYRRAWPVLLGFMCLNVWGSAALPVRLEREGVPLEQVASEDFTLVWKRISRTGLFVDPQQRALGNSDLLDPLYNKLLLIEYGISVSADSFARLTREPLQDAWSEALLEKHRSAIDKLCRLYRDVEAGDRYAIYWLAGRGLTLELNGEPLGVIEDAEAAQMILSIWLGRAAVSEDQRDKLLKAWTAYRRPADERLRNAGLSGDLP